MSEFHPPIYCDNQDDYFIDNSWHNRTVLLCREHKVCESGQEKKTEQILVKLPEPKRRRTIDDIKKWQPIMDAFEKMVEKR